MASLPFHRAFRLGSLLWGAFALAMGFGGDALMSFLVPRPPGGRGLAGMDRLEMTGQVLWLVEILVTLPILIASIIALVRKGTNVRWYWSWPVLILTLLYLFAHYLATVLPSGIVT